MTIKVRRARDSDFARIFEIEKRSYPPQLQTQHATLEYRHRVFGIWVAELDGEVAGFNTCVPIHLDWPRPDLQRFIRNRKPHYRPWFEEYEAGQKKGRNFNSLVNTSSAVETRYQGQGVGTALVKNSLKVAARNGLSHRVSALRCQFAPYHRKTGNSIEQFIEDFSAGKIDDRFLALYRKLGFVFAAPLPDYEPDRGSLNYCIFTYKQTL